MCLVSVLFVLLSFERFDLETSFLVYGYIFRMVEFIYQGYCVKVKVTRAKETGYMNVTKYTHFGGLPSIKIRACCKCVFTMLCS